MTCSKMIFRLCNYVQFHNDMVAEVKFRLWKGNVVFGFGMTVFAAKILSFFNNRSKSLKLKFFIIRCYMTVKVSKTLYTKSIQVLIWTLHLSQTESAIFIQNTTKLHTPRSTYILIGFEIIYSSAYSHIKLLIKAIINK